MAWSHFLLAVHFRLAAWQAGLAILLTSFPHHDEFYLLWTWERKQPFSRNLLLLDYFAPGTEN